MSWRGPGADPEDRAPPGEAPCWLPISPLQSSEEEAPTHLSTAGQRRAAERWGVGAGGANPTGTWSRCRSWASAAPPLRGLSKLLSPGTQFTHP